MFAGPARELFFENTHRHISYVELSKIPLDDHDNDARQPAAQSELERLPFDQAIVEGGSKGHDAGITYHVDKINVLNPQAAPEFRGEEHKTILLPGRAPGKMGINAYCTNDYRPLHIQQVCDRNTGANTARRRATYDNV